MPVTYEFDTVIGLGWIPYHERFDRVRPHNAYHRWAAGAGKESAISLLFYSGNPGIDDAKYESVASLRAFLRSKNYRGAVYLQKVRLRVNDDGTNRVTFDNPLKKEAIGYTPVRPLFWRSQYVLFYTKGVGTYFLPGPASTGTGAHLMLQLQFRLGVLANSVTRLTTGYWAPDVWMRVDYHLNNDGTGRVELFGSKFPNQIWRVGNAVPPNEHFHNTEQNTLDDVREILAGGPGRLLTNYYREIHVVGQQC